MSTAAVTTFDELLSKCIKPSDSNTSDKRDSRITFHESTHSYTVDGIKNSHVSCTTLVKQYTPVFEADRIIDRMQRGKNWNETHGYYGMSKQAIKDKWEATGKESQVEGTKLHKQIERFYNGMDVKQYSDDTKHTPEFAMFLKFHADVSNMFIPVVAEKMMFADVDKERICGQADMIFRKVDGTHCLVDWKRVKKIDKTNGFRSKMLAPWEHLDNCNFNHYSLQLNIYRYMLQKYYNFNITQLLLVVLHPINTAYKIVTVSIMEKEVSDLLEHRKVKPLYSEKVKQGVQFNWGS